MGYLMGRGAMAFGYESALDSILDSMERVDGLTVNRRSKTSPQASVSPEEAAREFETIAGMVLSDSDGNYLMESDRVHVAWYRGDFKLAGEFAVRSLHSCLSRDFLTFEDSRLTTEQQELMSNLKLFEETPGAGRMTGLLLPDAESNPEIWFYDISQPRLARLDIDFTAYLDTLLTTKGVSGWQLLFVELDLRSPEFRSTVDDLQEMLEYFPRVFPERDYEPLEARLEARL